MVLKTAENFINYTNDKGLTAKAQRVKNLQEYVKDINDQAKEVLAELDAVLITDPATIVAPEYFSNLAEIVAQSLEYWNKIDFPTRQQLFVRTSGWNSTFYFPSKEISLDNGLESAIKDIQEFIQQQNPEQIIIHPRHSKSDSLEKQFAIRCNSIPGDIHIQIGMGGQATVNKVESMQEHFEFDLKNIPNNIPQKFLAFINAVSIIAPIADSKASDYSTQVTDSNLPVYEIKGLVYKGQYLLNLFDYEIL